MFYCAQAPLLGKGLSFSKHAGVIAAFGKEFAQTLQVPAELHRFLLDAAHLREEGDYDHAAVFEKAECEEQIARAERFLEEAERYLGSST